MTTANHPQDDPRSVDVLVNAALSKANEDIAWQAVAALQWRGSHMVLQRAKELCVSRICRERRFGAYILGQLGLPERTLPAGCSTLLRAMLKQDEEPEVLHAALIGLSHQSDIEAVPLVRNFSSHNDPSVRHAVVLALTGHEVPLAINGLISLSNDPDSLVRDWATFALGTQVELDTPAIREALADRLGDSDDDTRGESLIGLARRKDWRVIDALKAELSSKCVGTLAIEAAELIASKDLLSYLVALREWWNLDSELLERAILASQS